MIDTNKHINNAVANSSVEFFESLKNKCSLPYKTVAEKNLMLVTERDESANSYDHFKLNLFAGDKLTEVELCSGLIIESDDCHRFIILNDRLADDPKLADEVKKQIKLIYPSSEFTIYRSDFFKSNLLSENLSFLHEFALLPPNHNDFIAIREFLELVSEASIKELKQRIKNDAAIYQLLFHRALRTDLENDLLCDDTLVNASPLINSIIKDL